MRKSSAALAALSLVVLALTGCSSAPSFAGATCDRAAHASNSLTDAVSASGEIGKEPKIQVFAPVAPKTSTFADVVTGDGTAIVSTTQPFTADVSIFSGATGEKLQATGYDASTTQPHDIAYWKQISPALEDALKCATAGSRVAVALTPDDLGQQASVGTAILVFDIVDVFLPKAEGTPQFNDAQGMPTVVRAPDGTPGVIIPSTTAPKKAVVQTLIKGDGPEVKEGDFVVVNHTALNWDDKSVQGTSWGSTSIVTAPLPEMVGKPVGSQIMIVTPSADSAPAQVLVIDILGISSAPPQQQP